MSAAVGKRFLQALMAALGRPEWAGFLKSTAWLGAEIGTSERQIRRWAYGESLPPKSKFKRLLDTLRQKGVDDNKLAEIKLQFGKLRLGGHRSQSRVVIKMATLSGGRIDVRLRMQGPPEALGELCEALDTVLTKLRLPPEED